MRYLDLRDIEAQKKKERLKEELDVVLSFTGFAGAMAVIVYTAWATKQASMIPLYFLPMCFIMLGWGHYAVELRRSHECAKCKQRDE